MAHNLFNSLQSFSPNAGKTGQFYSLPQLEKEGIGAVSKLPVSIRVVLESVLRNFDGERITEDDVRAVANWQPNAERTEEVPFVVARVLLQDFTGVPLLVDLAAMRSAVAIYYGKNNGIFPASETNVETFVTPAPTWQCGTPPTYTATNGKLDFTVTVDDCP